MTAANAPAASFPSDPARICSSDAEEELRRREEVRVRWVVAVTAITTVVELAVGLSSGSLALIAEGGHMASHAGALGLSAFAYWFARTRAKSERYTFGTGKVHALAGYTNAILLLLVAVVTIIEGGRRMFGAVSIDFESAFPVAVLGLVVNLVCVKLLHPSDHAGHDHAGHDHAGHDHLHAQAHDDHGHAHARDDHGHAHAGHDHGHQDDASASTEPVETPATNPNLAAAYFHVLGDLLASIAAIIAILGARYAHLPKLDPLMAILTSVIVLRWSISLSRLSASQLLDALSTPDRARAIRESLEALGARVVDLHLWELGPGRRGCVISLVAVAPKPLGEYRQAVEALGPLAHLTVEVGVDAG